MEENKLIQEIKELKTVKSFLTEHGFEDTIVDENPLVFCSYKIKLDKCKGCKQLSNCKQSIPGNAPTLYYNDKQILIDYLPCKYQLASNEQKEKKNNLVVVAANFDQYDLENVYQTNERKNLLIKVADIYNSYKNNAKTKGLYIYGPYGCGKSYMLAWLASKLVDLNAKVIFAYYPELVRQIKSSISEGNLEFYLEELKNVEVLMIDDIGGESNSDFIRDEVLGAILQTRMSNNALTFMSSNLNPKLLLDHLSSGSKDVDRVKGSRVFERISTLMEFVELKDKNYR